MSRRRYTGPQGKLQVALYAQAMRQPQKLHQLPDGTAERLAVRRLAEKGLLELDAAGARWKLKNRLR